MAVVRPFRALRPTPESATRVASVPYDVCNTKEARVLAEGNADSFLHVIRAEIDLADDADSHSAEVYALGGKNLMALRERGCLVQEEAACLYLYRQIMDGHAQTGLVGAYSVDEYDEGAIVKHEHTRPDKEADRTAHVTALSAQTGPVFLTYRPSKDLDGLVATLQAGEPFFDFTSPDGVQHTVWRVTQPQPFVDALAEVNPLYIADGHHRSASAANVRRQRREAGQLTDSDPSHQFLAVAFPTDQVQILAYNRLIHDLGERTPEAFLEALREVGELVATDDANPGPGGVCVYAAGGWHRLTLVPSQDSPVGRLAPQIVQDRVLGPLLGIENPRTDTRISFVGGIRGTGELQERVDAGEALIAFSLPPVTTDELLAVADAGLTMPPKSTWFEPKLRSGLLTYMI